jgi:hypothetical protein
MAPIMNWMPFNAVINAIVCCGGFVGVAYGVRESNYLFAAILGALALVSGGSLTLRVLILRRNRSIKRSSPKAETRWI